MALPSKVILAEPSWLLTLPDASVIWCYTLKWTENIRLCVFPENTSHYRL